MLPANVEKVKSMLVKPFQALPMATDLPRLANVKFFHNGAELPSPDSTATTLDKLEWIFSSLSGLLIGPEAAQDASAKFKQAFAEDVSASGTISKNQVTAFLVAIGGDESPVVKALKPINQVAISPAIIELKTLLGLDNMTKDVRNSWYFVVSVDDATVKVESRKRDQCIKNLFQMEWVLSFTFERPALVCTDVSLLVDDLLFHSDCHTKRVEKKDEVKRILKRYTSSEVLDAADTKTWEFNPAAASPSTSTISSPSMNAAVAPAIASPVPVEKQNTLAKVYANGDRYEGEMRHGIRHGSGVYTSANGDRFEGEYQNGLKNGRGVYTFKNGSRLEGIFEHGVIVHGTFTFANGDTYSGGFASDEFEGNGKWSSSDAAEVYVGSFVRGLRHGKGTLTLGSDTYEGDFVEDQMCGHGKYTFSNGDSYTGSFKAGKFDGSGEYLFASQRKVVVGDFKGGVLVQVTSTRHTA